MNIQGSLQKEPWIKMKKVIVFGNDHTNSVGVIQSLGKAGYESVGLLFGAKTDLVISSIYTSYIITAQDPQACVDKLLETCFDSDVKIPIIATCDMAALTLERNADRLKGLFVFEYSKQYTLEYLSKKENQVRLAAEAGFNVPKSWNLKDSKVIPDEVCFPCIIKPLVSCEGAKTDIRVCKTKEDLVYNLNNLGHTKNVLLQQYIERDYEISILGCALTSGKCIIPAVENKLTLYPKYVGLECLANIQPLEDTSIRYSIENLIAHIGYVGLFSVEMMHCITDGKFYFTEINLRNDGAEAFITKYGANLPLNHIEDLNGLALTEQVVFQPGYYIWEMHHLASVACGDISLLTWIKEIYKSNGFLMSHIGDMKPFFFQFLNPILQKLKIKKREFYK